MTALNAAAIERVLGPVDETLKAQILATGASQEELAEAFTWVNADDALVDEGRRLPTGRIATLVDLLQPPLDEEG